MFISIHAAREGGDILNAGQDPYIGISIHAAREGGDAHSDSYQIFRIRFQSTPPVKAATSSRVRSTVSYNISIHAAREGGDRPQL